MKHHALLVGKSFGESGWGGSTWGSWAGPGHVPLVHTGRLPPTGWPAGRGDCPSPTANSSELGKLTPGLGKEGPPHTQGQQSRGCPSTLPAVLTALAQLLCQHGGCLALHLLCQPNSQLSTHNPQALSQLWGRWAGTVNPPGSAGQGDTASSAWWRGS